MLGDFIHTLAVVKNICERENAIANIYLSDEINRYGGDVWKFGSQRAHADLAHLVNKQAYVNKFELFSNPTTPINHLAPFLNLNYWRDGITTDYFRDGVYCKSWSEFLSSCYQYKIKPPYKWIDLDIKDPDTMDKIVIHRSTHRHNPLFNWDLILSNINEEIIFLTCTADEYYLFPFKSDKIKMKLINTISEMASCINSCRLFIGNQSAPFALASALDVKRLVELRQQESKFYMGESKYSDNISWFLNNNEKHFTKQVEQWIHSETLSTN